MAEKYCGPLRPPASFGSNSTITRAQFVALLTDVTSTSTPAELAAMGLGAGVTSTLVNNNNGTYTYTDEEGTTTTFVSPRTASPKLLPLGTNLVFDADIVKYAKGDVPAAGMTFTPTTTGAIVGSTAVLELTATGGTEPNFSAFKMLSGSSLWDNTAGALNIVTVQYLGADSIWYSIAQEGVDSVEAQPPRILTLTNRGFDLTTHSVATASVTGDLEVILSNPVLGKRYALYVENTGSSPITLTFDDALPPIWASGVTLNPVILPGEWRQLEMQGTPGDTVTVITAKAN
jgi:hypothetical protein